MGTELIATIIERGKLAEGLGIKIQPEILSRFLQDCVHGGEAPSGTERLTWMLANALEEGLWDQVHDLYLQILAQVQGIQCLERFQSWAIRIGQAQGHCENSVVH